MTNQTRQTHHIISITEWQLLELFKINQIEIESKDCFYKNEIIEARVYGQPQSAIFLTVLNCEEFTKNKSLFKITLLRCQDEPNAPCQDEAEQRQARNNGTPDDNAKKGEKLGIPAKELKKDDARRAKIENEYKDFLEIEKETTQWLNDTIDYIKNNKLLQDINIDDQTTRALLELIKLREKIQKVFK